MTSAQAAQALSLNDLIAYKKQTQLLDTIARCFSGRGNEILENIRDTTTGMGVECRPITQAFLERGADANPETGFYGVKPVTPVSRPSHKALWDELLEVGVILKDDNDNIRLNPDITPLELIQHDSVLKRMLAGGKGGIFSTIEGIKAWATKATHFLLGLFGKCTKETDAAESVEIDKEEAVAYSLTQEKHIFPPKGGQIFALRFFSRIMDFTMARSPAQILAAAQDYVAERSNRLQAKRKASGTLAARTALAEQAWRDGQLARNAKSFPAKLDARYRKLLKDQVIRPAESLDLDSAEFLHWVAENWNALGSAYFAKSKSYPADPHFGWLIKCLATYSKAYTERDTVDLAPAPVQVPVNKKRVPEGFRTWEEYAEYLRVDRDAAHRELKAMTAGKELPDDDDPVYARIKEQASRKIVFGKFDDDEEAAPVRRKLRKHRK